MAQKHPLDDPEKRAAVIREVSLGGHLDVAAKAAGVNKRRLSRYLADHEDFAGQVATARRRAEVISTQAAAPPPSLGLEGSSCGALTPEGRSAFVALLEEHARDPQSRGCSKALDILA